ncbi:nickel-binding protein [Sediminibacterium sp. KACHI17]
MDLHIVPGVNAKDVAIAHSQDVYLEKDHNCKCLTYWVDEQKGHVFCLIDAPSKEVVYELHSRSHGLVPHKIIEVEPGLVQSFLGRITDPEVDEKTEDGLLLVKESSYRIMMLIQLPDPILYQYKHQNGSLIQQKIAAIKEKVITGGGRVALLHSEGIIGSFVQVEEAIEAAMHIMTLAEKDFSITIGLHGGEPVTKHEKFFGDTISLLKYLCFFAHQSPIRISNALREMMIHKQLTKQDRSILILSASDDLLINSIIILLEERYNDPTLQVEDMSRTLALSHSQLYRKIVALTGYSPNDLLRSFRLEKARKSLQKGGKNITEIAFENGFNSPSYFTKCFRESFGITPHEYAGLQ